MSVPAQLADVPPYQLQSLVASVNEPGGPFSLTPAGVPNEVRCAQALGSEIYVGCSNGELLRYAIEEHGPTREQSYILQSRQSLPHNKAIDDIVIVPSIARVLILSANQVHFYTLPLLDPVPQNVMLPLRNVLAFAVDEQHLARPPLGTAPLPGGVEAVDFCVVKRNSINLYQLRDRLFFQKDISLPSGTLVAACRRAGRYLCYADGANYHVADLDAGGPPVPLFPISQAEPAPPGLRPSITPVGAAEFLIVSWTGVSALGVFVTGTGDPVRGTLEWPAYPDAVALDGEHIHALLPDQSVEVHALESQACVQVVPPPDTPRAAPLPGWPPAIARARLVAGPHAFAVPSARAAEKMVMRGVKLMRP